IFSLLDIRGALPLTSFPYTTLFRSHMLAVGWTVKGVSAQSAIGDDGKSHPSVWFKHSPEGTPRALPITLVAHYQHADLTTFVDRSEEHTSELQSRFDLVCRLLLEKK